MTAGYPSDATAPWRTSHHLRHNDTDTKVVISAINSATDKAGATWIVRAGLATTTSTTSST